MREWSEIDNDTELKLKQCVIDFHTDRGRFLNAYAQTEYLVLDILTKIKPIIQYTALTNKFPSSTLSRIRTLKKVLSVDGPLKNYSSTFSKMMNLLEDNSEIRHYLAHGFSKITFSKKDYIGVELRRFNPKAVNPWKPDLLIYSFDDYQEAVLTISKIAAEVLKECRVIYDEMNLEVSGHVN